MLQKLNIRNYAIIENLQVGFHPGLNIITGETGAGKSILMGALNLILGERADSTVLNMKDKKSIVEAWFTLSGNNEVKLFFEENDLDLEEEIIIRREIAPNGKSRGFINDTPVNLTQLKKLGNVLVDLHQQFDTQELTNEHFQMAVIDALAENFPPLKQLKQKFSEYSRVKKQVEMLELQQAEFLKEQDYNQYLFDELNELALKENETELLEAELKLLDNAESVKKQLGDLCFNLSESELPVVQQLKQMVHILQGLQEYHPTLAALYDRLKSNLIELEDISDELNSASNSIHADAERIEIVQERLSAAYKLMKKHAVQHSAGLLAIVAALEEKLSSVQNIAGEIASLKHAESELLVSCTNLAMDISERRKSVTGKFSTNVNKLLSQVGMPNAVLKVEILPATLHEDGMDKLNFLFDANKSKKFEPLHKVASGGELSRLMLCIKSLVAKKLELPTLIFDEIDSGISGEAAKQVGIIMKELSGQHQMIAITHQPQIAARASEHLFVYKQIVNDRIVTSVKQLDNNERITAIAQMLSGEKPTAAALANAREMVSN